MLNIKIYDKDFVNLFNEVYNKLLMDLNYHLNFLIIHFLFEYYFLINNDMLKYFINLHLDINYFKNPYFSLVNTDIYLRIYTFPPSESSLKKFESNYLYNVEFVTNNSLTKF